MGPPAFAGARRLLAMLARARAGGQIIRSHRPEVLGNSALVPPSAERPRRVRADQLVVERGLAPTRSAAQALILAGRVHGALGRVEKPGQALERSAVLVMSPGRRFVSRGGLKLEGALEALGVDVTDAVVADLGAATGGFTDCLLVRGARKVFAIDVGSGLLADKLRTDPRVVVMERTNARHLDGESLGEPMDLVTVDASFIGIELLLPAVRSILGARGRLLAMLKPQFEAGRIVARRSRGVIRDPKAREAALERARAGLARAHFQILDECDAVLRGPKGNLERFVLAEPLHGPLRP